MTEPPALTDPDFRDPWEALDDFIKKGIGRLTGSFEVEREADDSPDAPLVQDGEFVWYSGEKGRGFARAEDRCGMGIEGEDHGLRDIGGRSVSDDDLTMAQVKAVKESDSQTLRRG
jgi:hypothetical protein